MRRIELKHFSPASCWSEFSLCGCSWGKSWVPHISGIFQLCLGCCSCSACWLWAPAMLCAQAELASWPKYLCFGRVWQATERAGSLTEPSLLLTEDQEMDPVPQPRKEGAVGASRGAAPWPWVPPGFRDCIDPAPALWKVCAQEGGLAFLLSYPGALVAAVQNSASCWCLGTRDLPSSMELLSLCSQQLHSGGTDSMRTMPCTCPICPFSSNPSSMRFSDNLCCTSRSIFSCGGNIWGSFNVRIVWMQACTWRTKSTAISQLYLLNGNQGIDITYSRARKMASTAGYNFFLLSQAFLCLQF